MTVTRKDDPDSNIYKMRRTKGVEVIDYPVTSTREEKDLGIMVDRKLTFETHIIAKVNKANQMVRRSCVYMDQETFAGYIRQ